MAAEDAGGSGDLAILVNTEMIVLKGAVKAAASAGSVAGKVVNNKTRISQIGWPTMLSLHY